MLHSFLGVTAEGPPEVSVPCKVLLAVEAPNPLPPLSNTIPTPVIGCHGVGVQARLDEGTLKTHILCQVESRLKHQWIVCLALGSRAASHQVTPVSAAVGVIA